jgi:hypothetical protein
MDKVERAALIATCLGAAAFTYMKVSHLSQQDHEFQPTKTISTRQDRFKVLNTKPNQPLKAPMGEYFLNNDGLYIHFRRWIPMANIHPLPPKGIVVIVHGLGEHCARYDHVSRALNAAGFVVYSLDHQGHGRSEGDRLHLNSFQDYVNDVMAVVNIAKTENPLIAKKTFLLGHSMGGKFFSSGQSKFFHVLISVPSN